jgi:hypothetical protein
MKSRVSAPARERHHHAVADLELSVIPPDLNDLSHALVIDDIAFLHLGDHTIVDVQIRAADGAGRNLDDGITRMQDLGIAHRLVAHVAFAMRAQGFHWRGSVLRG